jgi:ABC-type transport system involved in multi-copper enzyme maturation permease subunit
MFWNILTIENTKTLKRSMLWIELALLALLTIGIFVLIFIASLNTGGEALPPEASEQIKATLVWPGALMQALSLAAGNGLGGLLLIILVGAMTAQEYTWRTMHLWLGRGVPRLALVTAKFTATLFPALLFVLAPLAAGGITSGIFSMLLDGSLHLDQFNFAELLLAVLRTAFTLLPYAGLAFLLGIATRSTAAAIGGGLAYALLLEGVLAQILSLIGGTMGKLLAYLPTSLASALLTLNQAVLTTGVTVNGDPAGTIPLIEPAPAAIGIALWTAAFVGAALLIFRRQDLAE